MNIKAWIIAARLRTLPLAVACIGMGAFLAAYKGYFDLHVFLLLLLTTLLLQILSNLANDYGDFIHGADSHERKGPSRMVQSGVIQPAQMFKAVIIFGLASFFSGIALLLLAMGSLGWGFWVFLGLGLLAIFAAINYTAGAKPYGYAGLGDISVFVFFGLMAVVGSYWLFSNSWWWGSILPAISCGLLSTAVLNLNNMRDIESDKNAGKNTVAVRLGSSGALTYHGLLLIGAMASAVYFALMESFTGMQWFFLLSFPLLAGHFHKVRRVKNAPDLDPYLKQLALSTLIFVVLLGLSLVFF
jgi:1,4-dihydroxy-2-naphthoate octaprenyltransferase